MTPKEIAALKRENKKLQREVLRWQQRHAQLKAAASRVMTATQPLLTAEREYFRSGPSLILSDNRVRLSVKRLEMLDCVAATKALTILMKEAR